MQLPSRLNDKQFAATNSSWRDQNVQKSWAGFTNLLIKIPLNKKKLVKNHNYKAMDFANSERVLTKDLQVTANFPLVDTLLKRTVAKSQANITCRHLSEINSGNNGLSLMRILTWVLTVSSIYIMLNHGR